MILDNWSLSICRFRHGSGTNFGITNHETPNPNPNMATMETTINEIGSECLLRRRLHSLPHDIPNLPTWDSCELLKLEELFVAFLVECDDCRAAVVEVDEWALAWL